MAKENQRKALVTFSRSWFSLWLSLANFGICFIFCSWWQILIVLHFHSHFYRIHPILGFWCIFRIVFVCIILLSVASNGSAAFFGSIALLESDASFHVLLNLIWFPLDILVSFGNHRMERWSISITIFFHQFILFNCQRYGFARLTSVKTELESFRYLFIILQFQLCITCFL